MDGSCIPANSGRSRSFGGARHRRRTQRWCLTTTRGWGSIRGPRGPRSRPRSSAMQPAWSMGTRNPKTRHANQLYLDEIPALRKALLSDPASRAAYDAELAVAQMAERDAQARRAATAGPPSGRQGRTERVRSRAPGRRGGQARAERGRPAPRDPTDPEARRGSSVMDDDPSWMPTRPPTCSTRRLAGRSAWCSSIWAVAICMMRSACRAMPRHPTSSPRRCRTPALDEKGPGHRREDGLARNHHACAVAPELAQGRGAVRPDAWPRRPRSRSRAWRSLRSRA